MQVRFIAWIEMLSGVCFVISCNMFVRLCLWPPTNGGIVSCDHVAIFNAVRLLSADGSLLEMFVHPG